MVDFSGSGQRRETAAVVQVGLVREGNHDFWGPWHQNPWHLEPWSHGFEVPGGLHTMIWATTVYLESRSIDILVPVASPNHS